MDELKQARKWLAQKPPKSKRWIALKLGIPYSTFVARLTRQDLEAKHGGISSRQLTSLKLYKAFGKIWNDYRNFPVLVDIQRHLGIGKKAVTQRAIRYAEFRSANPNHKLSELIWRDNSTGGMVAVPEGVIRQLDEFRIKASKLKNPRGIVVTAAQYGAPLNRAFWKSLQGYAEYKKFPLVVLPIKYGPVNTVFQEQLQRRQLT